jgi:hypothetical protein
MSQNGPVAQGGKRAGKRVGPKKTRSFDAVLLALALGVTFCMVAWGYLVKAAIDFGTSARGGDAAAWAFLGLASLGAVACLFVGLLLVARITRRLGITRDPSSASIAPVRQIQPGLHVEFPDDTAEVPSVRDVPAGHVPRRAAGGRRAAR